MFGKQILKFLKIYLILKKLYKDNPIRIINATITAMLHKNMFDSTSALIISAIKPIIASLIGSTKNAIAATAISTTGVAKTMCFFAILFLFFI